MWLWFENCSGRKFPQKWEKFSLSFIDVGTFPCSLATVLKLTSESSICCLKENLNSLWNKQIVKFKNKRHATFDHVYDFCQRCPSPTYYFPDIKSVVVTGYKLGKLTCLIKNILKMCDRVLNSVPYIAYITYTSRLLQCIPGDAVPYCTVTTLVLFWLKGSSDVTMEYLHSCSVIVPTCLLQGNSGATSKEQHCYFCVGACICVKRYCNRQTVILLCMLNFSKKKKSMKSYIFLCSLIHHNLRKIQQVNLRDLPGKVAVTNRELNIIVTRIKITQKSKLD